jgi:hypothetical protein
MRLHINWGACSDWHAARAKLTFLKVTLYANFADVEGERRRIKAKLVQRGFTVTYEGDNLIRLSDGVSNDPHL